MDTTDTQEIDNEPQYVLPPKIVNNPRQMVEAELIPPSQLLSKLKPKRRKSKSLKVPSKGSSGVEANPKFPLELSCSPTLLCFQIDQDTVTQETMERVQAVHLRPVLRHVGRHGAARR